MSKCLLSYNGKKSSLTMEITIKETEIFKKVATVNWPKTFYKAAQDPKAWS